MILIAAALKISVVFPHLKMQDIPPEDIDSVIVVLLDYKVMLTGTWL